jgi:hypothetical protein
MEREGVGEVALEGGSDLLEEIEGRTGREV